jgi:hypothetical protein
MKYLFFFNGQPLLLCCVCCKIAIQDFVTGLHKKKKLWFHRRVYRQTITCRYFTESCKTITGLCHHHLRVRRRPYRCKIPTDLRTSRSARMSDTCLSAQIPMNFCTSRSARMSDTYSSAQRQTDFPIDRKVWRDF